MADRLQVDLTNPDDIRERLPDVERLVREKEADFQEWDRLADRLAKMAGVKRKNRRSRSRAGVTTITTSSGTKVVTEGKPHSSQRQVVKIVNDHGGPLRVGEVFEQVSNVSRDTVSWALWQAEKDNEIQRVRKGVYAPLDFDPSSPKGNKK